MKEKLTKTGTLILYSQYQPTNNMWSLEKIFIRDDVDLSIAEAVERIIEEDKKYGEPLLKKDDIKDIAIIKVEYQI
jgi:hypothetical protein